MILIALGSNLPLEGAVPQQTLDAALAAMADEGIHVCARSRWYSTAPVPASDQPRYINAVALVETALDPAALMEKLHKIEDRFRRARSAPNAARTLDLDLIDYDGRVMNGELILPHPRLAERGFVLQPLAEVAPEWRHPVSGRNVAELIAALPPQDVRLI
jgi:2-amino-4-hydroxy-6-hydroxymethyldihydropteridine diphosphokinase